MSDKRQLARIHRVRTLQLTLARAEEARAHAQLATETQLANRIAQLARNVAPQSGGAVSMGAAAHYRDRLTRSAQNAAWRVEGAEAELARAAEGARAAKRDQSAVEKLIERADLEAVKREMKRLEDAPARPKRHNPC